MNPSWGGNRGRGCGSRGRGRGWRGNSSGPPRGGGHRGGGPCMMQPPMEYMGGPQRMRGHRGGGFRGYNMRAHPDNFNQIFTSNLFEPSWVRMRGRPSYSSGPHHRRPFVTPPHGNQTPARPSSPLPGSEEYMQRDISEKSALLKRQLELEGPAGKKLSSNNFGCDFPSATNISNFCDYSFMPNTNPNLTVVHPVNSFVENKSDLQSSGENVASPRRSKRNVQRQKQQQTMSVEEIHDKIIKHISNLSHVKKINLVNQAVPSAYDVAIQQITRQKRLALSKALRDMCNNKFKEVEDTSSVIQSIIPDFDIKIDELPREVVQQLSSTLDVDVEEHVQGLCIDPEVMFQRAANMLNTIMDADTHLKENVGLVANDTLEGGYEYQDFQNVGQCGDMSLDQNFTQNMGDSSVDYMPNDAQMQPSCCDMPIDETMASHGVMSYPHMQSQPSPIDFSVPPPMNFSGLPPMNISMPPRTIIMCQQPINEYPMEFADPSQNGNHDLMPEYKYNLTFNNKMGDETEPFQENTEYYSPSRALSDENSPQASPIFNDLMMGQDPLIEGNIEQSDLSLSNVDEVLHNPCDNPSFNLIGEQESDQYFADVDVDDGILMPGLSSAVLSENLTDTGESYFEPNGEDVQSILLPPEPCKDLMPPFLEPTSSSLKVGKAVILSDIRILPPKVASRDVLTEATEQSLLDTNKSKKVSFTFTKTNLLIKSKMIDLDEVNNQAATSSALHKGPKSPQNQVLASNAKEATVKDGIQEELRLTNEIKEQWLINVEAKPDGESVRLTSEVEAEPKVEAKTREIGEKLRAESVVQGESVILEIQDKNARKSRDKNEADVEKQPEQKGISLSHNIHAENELKQSKIVPNSFNLDKSRERVIDNNKFANVSKRQRTIKIKSKDFDENEDLKKQKKFKLKFADLKEYPKLKYGRSRYDKLEDGYKKKYKEKLVMDEDRHKWLDSDRSFEKCRDKFRESDSEHSTEVNRYSKYNAEREDTRHPKRYYHDSYTYRVDYVDHQDYCNPQKYPYSSEYYPKQEYPNPDSPYSPEDFEPTSFHHSQKHKTRHDKPHKKHSKKHKRQREQSASTYSSFSDSDIVSSSLTNNRKPKHHKGRQLELVEVIDDKPAKTKGHKKPLKERIQVLNESKVDLSLEADCDEDCKIMSEPVSPKEVNRKPLERSRSAEKVQNSRDSVQSVSPDDLRQALNLKAQNKASPIVHTVGLIKSLGIKTNHPPTPVVPFTNKPCPRKQVEDPLREREVMIKSNDKISFRNKSGLPSNKPLVEEEMLVEQEDDLQSSKELPDIDNIAKIISNLSTIVKLTKEGATKPVCVKFAEASTKSVRKMPEKGVKKCEQRPWKSPGEKKFMMEHLRGNSHLEKEELGCDMSKDQQTNYNKTVDEKFDENLSENFREQQLAEEKLVFVNPEPTVLKNVPEVTKNVKKVMVLASTKLTCKPVTSSAPSNSLNKLTLMKKDERNLTKLDLLKVVKSPLQLLADQNEIISQDQVKLSLQTQNVEATKSKLAELAFVKKHKKEPHPNLLQNPISKSRRVDQGKHPDLSSKAIDSLEIHSTTERLTAENLPKEAFTGKPQKLLIEPREIVKTIKLEPVDVKPCKPITGAKAIVEVKTQPKSHTKKRQSKFNSTRRSKSRSRSKPKEPEILHSAEVSSTSDTAAKSHAKPTPSSARSSRSRSKSKARNLTPLPPNELFKSDAIKKSREPIPLATKANPTTALVKFEDAALIQEKMLVTTYTQTHLDDNNKSILDADLHVHSKNRKDVSKSKKQAGSSRKSEKRGSKYVCSSVNTQTATSNANISTQTPTAHCKNVQVQVEALLDELVVKKAAFAQTDPVVILDGSNEMDQVEPEGLAKAGRKTLRAVRRRKAIERMFDLDKEIDRLTKLRQSLYNHLNFNSDSDDDDRLRGQQMKVARVSVSENSTDLLSNKIVNLKQPVQEKLAVCKKIVRKKSEVAFTTHVRERRVAVKFLRSNKRGQQPNTSAPINKITIDQIPDGLEPTNQLCQSDKHIETSTDKPETNEQSSTMKSYKSLDMDRPPIEKLDENEMKVEESEKSNPQMSEQSSLKTNADSFETQESEQSDLSFFDVIQKSPEKKIDLVPPKSDTETPKDVCEPHLNDALEILLKVNSEQPTKLEPPKENEHQKQNHQENDINSNIKTNIKPSTDAVITIPNPANSALLNVLKNKVAEPEKSSNRNLESEDMNAKESDAIQTNTATPMNKPKNKPPQTDKSGNVNSETGGLVRSTRSRNRKQLGLETTSSSTAPPKPGRKPRGRKKLIPEPVQKDTDGMDTSAELLRNVQQPTPTPEDTNSNQALTKPQPEQTRRQQRRSAKPQNNHDESEDKLARRKKRSDASKSPKQSKEESFLSKVKVKPAPFERKRKLEESPNVLDCPTMKRRRKITANLEDVVDLIPTSKDSQDELKIIDEAIKTETTNVITQREIRLEPVSLSKLRRRVKTQEGGEGRPGKFRQLKNVPRWAVKSKDIAEELSEKVSISGSLNIETDTRVSEGSDSSPDSSLLLGFKRISEFDSASINPEELPPKEQPESSNKLNGNVTDPPLELKLPKRRKKKKINAIDLELAIDSQNLLQGQEINQPPSIFDPNIDGEGGAQKKKKRYPFSGIKTNYRTKKRKSSTDLTQKPTLPIKKKSSSPRQRRKSSSAGVVGSIVKVTRFSIRQLEAMRESIREKKEQVVPEGNEMDMCNDFQGFHKENLLEQQNTQSPNDPSECVNLSDTDDSKILNETLNCEAVLDSQPTLEPVVSQESDLLDTDDSVACAVVTAPVPKSPTPVVFLEEENIAEEVLSVKSVDFCPEGKTSDNVPSMLHLETSNKTFEDFVKESLENKDSQSFLEPPVLMREVDDYLDVRIDECEYLEIVDDDDDYKMDFGGFTGAILVIKVIASTALAASDKGKLFCFDMLNGTLTNIIDMSKLAITSMIIIKRNDVHFVYTGSLDSSIAVLNFDSKEVVKQESLPEPVQCMEHSWNYIFVGSDRGSLIRLDLNTDQVEDAIKISDSNVLVIKATQEGPRKVLVVATRNAPVCVRDASSGLLLRTMETPFSPTVYTLLFEKNLIYCGTSQHDILVYTFEDGQLIFKHEATKSKGVVCMQIVGNLLFAGCYNGNIYVYNTKTNIHLGTMNGPGGLMLSMEIVRNKIIVGTKSSNFRAWRIPQNYLDQM